MTFSSYDLIENLNNYSGSGNGNPYRTLSDNVSKILYNKSDCINWHYRFLGNTCLYCGKEFIDYSDIQQDHIIAGSFLAPLIKGNFVLACQNCNISKSNHFWKDYILTRLERELPIHPLFESNSDKEVAKKIEKFYNDYSIPYKTNLFMRNKWKIIEKANQEKDPNILISELKTIKEYFVFFEENKNLPKPPWFESFSFTSEEYKVISNLVLNSNSIRFKSGIKIIVSHIFTQIDCSLLELTEKDYLKFFREIVKDYIIEDSNVSIQVVQYMNNKKDENEPSLLKDLRAGINGFTKYLNENYHYNLSFNTTKFIQENIRGEHNVK